ncbi:Macrophage mannose receptor 1-like protein 1, partial [Aphelenchoides avenae]
SPSCPSDSLNCVSFNASTGKWHDEVCTAKKPFVCLIEDNSQASHCADEWTYNDATKLCYYVVGTIRDITADTWPTAQRWCSGVNGNLVTIHDAATNDDVLRYARDAGFNNNHFPIGLKYEQKTKAWTWRDGSAMDFTNWAPGFPVDERDQYGHGKDYAYMWMYGGNASLWMNDWKETYNHFPIGLRYNGTTRACTWRDGSAMDYTNWAPGYPIRERNMYGQGTDYAYMWMYGANASIWINDYKQTCEESLVLCEQPPKA